MSIFDLPQILSSIKHTNIVTNKDYQYVKGFSDCAELVKIHFDKNPSLVNLHLQVKELQREKEFLEHDLKIYQNRNKILNEKVSVLESDSEIGTKKTLKRHFAANVLGIVNKSINSLNLDSKQRALSEIEQLCKTWMK